MNKLILLLVLLYPSYLYSQPVFDAAGSGDGGIFGDTSVTASITVSGTNRYIYCAVATNSATDVVTGVTYAGAALAKLDSDTAGGAYTITYWWKIAPSTGTNNAIASLSSSNFVTMGCASFTNVSQSVPHGTSVKTNTGSSPITSPSITNTATDLVVDAVVAAPNGTFTVAGGQTQRVNHADAGNRVIVGNSTKPGTGSGFTMSWSNFNYSAIVAVPLKENTGGGGMGAIPSSMMLLGVQ